MKKNIILILPNAGGGGSEKVLINLANLLSIQFNVTLCFINLNKYDYLKLIEKKIKIINLNKKSSKRSFFKLLKIINENKYEYVLSSIFHINVLSILLKFFSFNSFKLIIRETNKIYLKEKNFIKLFLIFIFYRFANLIISPSKLINKELASLRIKKKKIKHLNNPVIINQKNNKEKLKKIEHFLSKDKYLITMTRLEKHKNIDFILDCVKEVNKYVNLKLIILGDGNQKKKLNTIIKRLGLIKKVKIVKFLSYPYDILKNSSIYVNSSYYEGQSNSVLEALYFNIPVVSANNGSHTYFIKKYSYGYVFDKFDKDKVTKKILRLIYKKPKKINLNFYNEINGLNITKRFIKLINNI